RDQPAQMALRVCLKPLVFVVLWAAAPAHAQDLATVPTGTMVETSARIWRHLVPLPPGTFELVTRQVAANQNAFTLAELRMMAVTKSRVDTMLFIQTNRDNAGPGRTWTMTPRCRSENRAYFKFMDESRRDHVCWAVFGVSYDINTTPEPAYNEFRRRTGEVA